MQTYTHGLGLYKFSFQEIMKIKTVQLWTRVITDYMVTVKLTKVIIMDTVKTKTSCQPDNNLEKVNSEKQ